MIIYLLSLVLTLDLSWNLDSPVVELVARPNPYDRGNCYHWIGCQGESIGSMWIDTPEYCGALGGKSWKDEEGGCHDLPEGPWSTGP